MEYGHEINSTDGSKTFFVEGCTCCSMTTGGLHEPGCSYNNEQRKQHDSHKRYLAEGRFDPAIFYEEPTSLPYINNNN